MKMQFLWSAKHNAFFPEPMVADYELAGWDLTDAIAVSQDVFAEFTTPTIDCVRIVGSDGMPAWEAISV